MSAFIPNRREPEVTENALAKVREDKEREAGDGFDGTWVAHPDLVPVAMEVFDRALGDRPEPEGPAARGRRAPTPTRFDRLRGTRRRRSRRRVWRPTCRSAFATSRRGWPAVGAAALDNLMEDAATAEISRSQVWQWVKTGKFSRDQVLAAIEPWRSHDAARGRTLRAGRAVRRLRRVPDPTGLRPPDLI